MVFVCQLTVDRQDDHCRPVGRFSEQKCGIEIVVSSIEAKVKHINRRVFLMYFRVVEGRQACLSFEGRLRV